MGGGVRDRQSRGLGGLPLATNVQEYWAEGVQAWFNGAAVTWGPTVHSGIWYHDQLRAYDPNLAQPIAELYADGPWRYVRTDGKPLVVDGRTFTVPPADLARIDRSTLPAFGFENSPRVRVWPATSRPSN